MAVWDCFCFHSWPGYMVKLGSLIFISLIDQIATPIKSKPTCRLPLIWLRSISPILWSSLLLATMMAITARLSMIITASPTTSFSTIFGLRASQEMLKSLNLPRTHSYLLGTTELTCLTLSQCLSSTMSTLTRTLTIQSMGASQQSSLTGLRLSFLLHQVKAVNSSL